MSGELAWQPARPCPKPHSLLASRSVCVLCTFKALDEELERQTQLKVTKKQRCFSCFFHLRMLQQHDVGIVRRPCRETVQST